jgi:hypothetical protein
LGDLELDDDVEVSTAKNFRLDMHKFDSSSSGGLALRMKDKDLSSSPGLIWREGLGMLGQVDRRQALLSQDTQNPE